MPSQRLAEQRRRLVIATGNAGKLREYRELLAETGLELVAYDTEVDEVGETYAENARLKAEAALTASGLPSLGDDSGVEVERAQRIPGHPVRAPWPHAEGAHSAAARSASRDILARGPRASRARIALAAPGRDVEYFEGECRGELVPEWRGEAGFGYDPIFLVPGTGKTFGEMPTEEKRLYSHRANAVRAMLASGALETMYG